MAWRESCEYTEWCKGYMNKYLLIGSGGHAKMIKSLLVKDEFIEGYIDLKVNTQLPNVAYLGNDLDALEFLDKDLSLIPVFGIGLIKNIEQRAKIIKIYKDFFVRFQPIKSASSIVDESVKIDCGTVIGNGAVVNNGTKIGKFSIINSGAIIEHDVKIGDNVHIAPGAIVCGDVQIENNITIGAGTVINQGLKVVGNVIIGSGSVVNINILESGTYVGTPVRRIN